MRKETLLQIIKINYVCDFCSDGLVSFTKIKNGIDGKCEFEHACLKCNAEVYLPVQYPYIEYKE